MDKSRHEQPLEPAESKPFQLFWQKEVTVRITYTAA